MEIAVDCQIFRQSLKRTLMIATEPLESDEVRVTTVVIEQFTGPLKTV